MTFEYALTVVYELARDNAIDIEDKSLEEELEEAAKEHYKALCIFKKFMSNVDQFTGDIEVELP